MTRLMSILLAAALVVAGCSSDGDEQADDVNTTVTVAEVEDSSGPADGDIDLGGGGSILAFVDTPPSGPLDVVVAADAPDPTTIEVDVIEDPTRSGLVGTDGVATIAYVLGSWDGVVVDRSSDLAERLSVKLGQPADSPPDAVVLPEPFQDVLDGQPVGARVTAVFPAGTPDMPIETAADKAYVLVIDILAFQQPEDS